LPEATPHQTLNSLKGVIRCAELKHASEDEIITELADQGVVDCFNIQVKGQDGVRQKTNIYILTFNTSALPKHIKIGFLHTEVEMYIPNPLRCFRCQKYGHGKNVCRNTAVCAHCGEQHPLIVDMLPYLLVQGKAFQRLNFSDPAGPRCYKVKSEKYLRTMLMPSNI